MYNLYKIKKQKVERRKKKTRLKFNRKIVIQTKSILLSQISPLTILDWYMHLN